MLGRQQIAGIPTAISELFKNAHDANAERVVVDFYRSNGLFVLRDDGDGMTRDEFSDRWLTIATEASHRRKNARRRGGGSHGKRPILGEKGIGRLAIATIGPQVLVLTRARSEGQWSDLTAAFVNWRLFECSDLNLEDVRIPIQTYQGLPRGSDVADIIGAFRRANAGLRERVGDRRWARIGKDLDRFSVDPSELADFLGQPSSLADGDSGTHFYLLPTSDRLIDDIDGESDSDVAPPIQRALLGFTTPSLADHPKPVIHTAFRDHATDGTLHDHIGANQFFTRAEYNNADHRIWGKFDKFGQFTGSVSVYGEITRDHIISWQGAKGRQTKCGPFGIRFAAVEGMSRHSTLPSGDHASILRKTRMIGGLYIYRDGVRMQPYGNTDYDWLEIELRRTKSASYYYFSYRQMFGLVEIDSRHNNGLQEKAGREGFLENKAYRQFRSILKNFFFLVQVAADFFRQEGVHSERFLLHKKELQEIERHRKARAARVRPRQRKFRDDLDAFFRRFEEDDPREAIVAVGVTTEERVRKATSLDSEPDRIAATVRKIEHEASEELKRLESRYHVSRPRVGISRALQRDWKQYLEVSADIHTEIGEICQMIEGVIDDELTRAGVRLDARERVKAALEDQARVVRRKVKKERANVDEAAKAALAEVRATARKCVADVERVIRVAMTELGRSDLASLVGSSFADARPRWEDGIHAELERASKTLESLRLQLSAIEPTGSSSVLEQLMAVEQHNIDMREQAAADLQLTQLGMAIEIISHEFGAAIRTVRSGLRSLKAWADVNDELMSLYRSIRGSFDHLDGYLTLFTPLQRRLYRKAVDIRGWQIHDFLNNLFGQRLARHNVKMVQTDAFAKSCIRGYPSSFYPVFGNLVDNAIYWLSGQNEQSERTIKLDADGKLLIVSDSGPGIRAIDREDIFEVGFTRKPGGRGMGLPISRQTLHEAGYAISVAEQSACGATFLIMPIDAGGVQDDV